MELSEFRSWVQFALVVAGGIIGFAAFFQNMRQRKIENALKMIAWFKNTLEESDMKAWETLFHLASESAGATPGYFIGPNGGEEVSIEYYYAEGAPDGGAIARMTDSLEVVCYEMVRGTVDARFVWFELGQLLSTISYWLTHVISYDAPSKSLLKTSFPNIDKAFKQFERKFKSWPHRTIAYVE